MTIQFSLPDLLEIVGYLFSSWITGFIAGYLMTKFRQGIDMSV